MSHFGRLQDYRFSEGAEAADDIRGAKIYGLDGEKIGKIDDVIFDHGSGNVQYVVVDTGGWLSSKKFIVPPDQLQDSPDHDGDFEMAATKEQIESLPPYNESDVESNDRWKDYEKRYKAAWRDDPVQHRKGSDRDITPTPDEMPEEPDSIGSQLSPSERAEISERIIPATANEVTIQSGGTGIGSRWLTFEDRLRQRRRDITLGCTTCAIGSASESPKERKAS